jgi:hypothetical protein
VGSSYSPLSPTSLFPPWLPLEMEKPARRVATYRPQYRQYAAISALIGVKYGYGGVLLPGTATPANSGFPA